MKLKKPSLKQLNLVIKQIILGIRIILFADWIFPFLISQIRSGCNTILILDVANSLFNTAQRAVEELQELQEQEDESLKSGEEQ